MKYTILALVFALVLSSVLVSASLVSEYTFDTSCATDELGLYNGTVTGVSNNASVFKIGIGSCYWDGGGGDNIQLPSAQTNNMSSGMISFWVKFDSESESYNIFAKSNASMRVQYDSGFDDYYFYVNTGSGAEYTTANSDWSDWRHVVVGWDGSRKYQYLDGVLYVNVTDSGQTPSGGNLYLGTNSVNTNQDLKGYLDEFCVYDAFDSETVSALYNNGSGIVCTLTPEILYQGQTPANNENVYYVDNVSINTTSVSLGGSLNFTHFFYDENYTLLYQYNGSGSDPFVSNYTNLSVGKYYFNTSVTNGSEVVGGDTRSINITLWNALVNVTVKTAIGGSVISNFSGWAYTSETGLNSSFSTSSGQVNAEVNKGNVTVYVESSGYAVSASTNYAYLNVTQDLQNVTLYLYDTNSLNITFYDESDPETLLSGPLISLDLISDVFSGNYSTTNGSIFISLLSPTNYTLRYSANGFTERFYYVQVSNNSFSGLSLYLINDTVYSNISVYVVDEILNPVEGAVVKALKYYLPDNSYILQEVGITDISGVAIMSLTKNDEYYKFIVEYQGETKKITTPATIKTDSLTIGINFGQSVAEEYYNYKSIDWNLAFTDSTNNYRFDYNDVSGLANEYCLRVYKYTNLSITPYDSECDTASVGTLLINVANETGVTYVATATYVENGEVKILGSLFKSFPEDTLNNTRFGLFLQILLTVAFGSFALLSVVFAAITVPFSLIVGKWIGLITIPWTYLVTLQVTGFVVAMLLTRKQK